MGTAVGWGGLCDSRQALGQGRSQSADGGRSGFSLMRIDDLPSERCGSAIGSSSAKQYTFSSNSDLGACSMQNEGRHAECTDCIGNQPQSALYALDA